MHVWRKLLVRHVLRRPIVVLAMGLKSAPVDAKKQESESEPSGCGVEDVHWLDDDDDSPEYDPLQCKQDDSPEYDPLQVKEAADDEGAPTPPVPEQNEPASSSTDIPAAQGFRPPCKYGAAWERIHPYLIYLPTCLLRTHPFLLVYAPTYPLPTYAHAFHFYLPTYIPSIATHLL